MKGMLPLLILCVLLFLSCTHSSSNSSLKGTEWKLDIPQIGSSTLVFKDSTYIATIKTNKEVKSGNGTYTFHNGIVIMNLNGLIDSAKVEDNKLTTFANEQSLPITFIKQSNE